MAERLLLASALVAIAVVVAVVLQRRRPDVPTQPVGYHVPAQLDRADFERLDAPWLVVVFSSATCSTCAAVWERAELLASGEVAVQEVELSAEPELHARYRIDGVPTTVIADADGVVRGHFLGPVTATDLWARVAELREPGSTPGACQRHDA